MGVHGFPPLSGSPPPLLGNSIFSEPGAIFQGPTSHKNILGSHYVPIHNVPSLTCPCVPFTLELAVHKH